MVGLVFAAVISCATVIRSQSVEPNPNNGSTGIVQPANLCAYYGTGNCCPLLNTTNASIVEGYIDQPIYVSFAPRPVVENVDNICYTMLPLPDGVNTFKLFISTVYSDGTNTIDTSIVTQKFLGTFTSGSPKCTFVDIIFDEVMNNVLQCNVGLLYRCVLHGECPRTRKGIVQPLFGTTFIRRPLPRGCWRLIDDIFASYGFTGQDYLSLPMKLPSRCVLHQTCSVTPVIQLFQLAAGINYNQKSNC